MSLQVWLPLNGDLHNQGLSNCVFTNGNVVVDNDGKIGKCYSFSSENSSYLSSTLTLSNTGPWSASAWVYPTTSSSSGHQYIVGLNSTNSTFLFNLCWYGNKFGIRLGSTTYQSTTSYALNAWYHVAFSYNGSQIKLYINGILDKTQAFSSSLNNYTNLYIGKRGGNAGYFSGKLNDIRIYDHALSDKEVKEIAKGLVLHYKLDQNLNPLNNCYNYPTFNTSTSSGGWNHWGGSGHQGTYGQNTDKQYIFNTQNTYSHWIANGSSATNNYLVYQSPAFEGGTRSLQAIIKEENNLPITNAICYPAWNARNGGVPNNLWTDIVLLGNGFYLCKCENISQDGSNDLVGIYVRAGYKIYISEAYLENDRAICSDIFNQNILNTINDCSGYNNNGTVVNTLFTSNNTAKYSNSFIFSNSSYIKCTPFYFNTDKWSYSFWYYKTSQPSAYEGFICLSKDNGGDANKKFAAMPNTNRIWFKCESGSGNLNSLYTGQWVHIVETSEGKVYENGIYKISMTPGTLMTGCTDLVIGARAASTNVGSITCPYSGQISDVRIYATVLSDEDILDLYHTPFSIDNKGNSYAREIIEDTSLNITKTGQFHGNEMLDDNTFTTASITKDEHQLKVNTLYEY